MLFSRIYLKLKKEYKKMMSIFLYRISGSYVENYLKLQKLKDIHKGKRAFIICNGPSLKSEDLTTIYNSGEISFASNKIHKIFSKTPWRPMYYTVMDENYQFSLIDIMNLIPAKYKFFRVESWISTRKVSGSKIFLNTIGGRKLLKECRFSDNCSKVVFTVATVTYTMIQLAVYMGIKEIYIIGCDNSYSREINKDGTYVDYNVKSYFEGSDNSDQLMAASVWQMNIAFECARKYADTHGIKIYNATRGGNLNAFERVCFDSLF